jgi:hypothetical protein
MQSDDVGPHVCVALIEKTLALSSLSDDLLELPARFFYGSGHHRIARIGGRCHVWAV